MQQKASATDPDFQSTTSVLSSLAKIEYTLVNENDYQYLHWRISSISSSRSNSSISLSSSTISRLGSDLSKETYREIYLLRNLAYRSTCSHDNLPLPQLSCHQKKHQEKPPKNLVIQKTTQCFERKILSIAQYKL